MKRLRLYAFFLCATMFITLLPMMARAETPIIEYVDYDITENTTWHAGDYYICKVDNREPMVTNGATLTIESGTKVYFSTRTTTEIPESGGKNPYSSLTVTNGSLVANGVTFTTVPDAGEQTTWRGAGWNGIQAIGLPAGVTSLSFTNCIFEYSGFNDVGTLYGGQTNAVNSEVNISMSDCTFRDPKAGATAICYYNGYNTVGTGTIIVSGSTFTGYGRGVQVLDNQEDAVNTTVTGCTFSNISVRPLEINGGRQASVTSCTFDNFVDGQHNGAVLIFDTDSATSQIQTVTLTGNTFNYGDTATIYPVLIGAGCKINENVAAVDNTFDANYPAAYRYISLTRGVGYLDRHRSAVWGDAGIPYLLASEIIITGADETNESSLTIKPGVTVCLGDGTAVDNLDVRGALTAEGTADKPITFTKKTDVAYGNEIAVGNNLKSSIVLKHCIMDGLYRSIGITSPSNAAGSSILLENCTVRNTQEPMVLNGYNVLVKNCALIGKGIWIDGVSSASSIMIEGCSITADGENTDFGVGIKSTKSVTLKNCLIAGFDDCGVAIINNAYQTLADGAPLIENCIISRNRNGVVCSKTTTYTRYGAYIRNSIISGNTEIDLASKAYTYNNTDYDIVIEAGSIAYSLIGNDGSSLTFDGSDHYEHPVLGKISEIATTAYSNRVTGDPLFANAASGDYHLKSAAGRWNGSDWVNDAVTSPCIDAGDPASAYANEPTPNGGRINLGCYGNTAHASKSGDAIASYTITLPDGKVDGYTAYAVEAHGGSTSPVAHGGSYSFNITVANAFYKSDAFKVKANGIELTPDSATGVYTIDGITANQVITVEGVAKIDTPNITTQPTDQSVAVGVEANFRVAAEGYNLTYSWQVSKDGGSTWENIEGAASAEYEISSPALSQSGWQYRCWVKSSANSGMPYFVTQSNIVTLTVIDLGTQYNILVIASPSAGGTITASPTTAAAGETITLTITPDTGKRLKAGSLKYNDGTEDHAISGTTFTMPAANVTVTAEFEDVLTPVTDHDKVMADIAALSIGYAPGDSATAVTQNVSLTVTGAVYGSIITWTSSNTAVISDSGVVTRPGFASGDAAVTVTAMVYNNGASSTKDFDLVVLKLPQIIYMVTFDKNGGDTEPSCATKEVISGGNVGTLPTAPTRSGYTFDGWNTQANGSGTALTAATAVTGSITVYAQWSRNSSEGGGGSSGSSGNAAVTVSQAQVSDAISKAMDEAEKQIEGTIARVEIKVEASADATTAETIIPKEAVSQALEAGIGTLTISTPVASITFDVNTLSALSEEAIVDIKITASKVEASSLSPEVQRKIGDRPVFDFSVISGDKIISQFEGDVSVSVPYTPKEGEDTNAIVIYYINDSGELEVVSNCIYDPATGMLSFSTRHFSLYAVGYNKVNFKDVAEGVWYSKAIGFIAAREITIGTGDGNFSPKAKLTRGQFIIMLMKAYGIAPDADPKDNFADAGATYYTGYMAAAKRLSISNGVGNNMFAPDKEITRQEMFTLLYNVLKAIERLPKGTDGKQLSAFADAENIASWAKEAMTLLVETGTISGNGGKLSPTSTTTRAEMAQVLYNLLSK